MGANQWEPEDLHGCRKVAARSHWGFSPFTNSPGDKLKSIPNVVLGAQVESAQGGLGASAICGIVGLLLSPWRGTLGASFALVGELMDGGPMDGVPLG